MTKNLDDIVRNAPELEEYGKNLSTGEGGEEISIRTFRQSLTVAVAIKFRLCVCRRHL